MPEKQSETVLQPSSTVIDLPSRPTASAECRAIAECLRDYAAAYNDGSKMFRFLSALAAEVLLDLDKGGTGQAITKSIYLAANSTGEPERAARWSSEAWNDWLKKRNERLSGLQDFAANRGLNVYPWPEKKGDSKGGAGRPTVYTIEAQPFEKQDIEEAGEPNSGLRYIRETTPKAAWWIRWYLSKEFQMTGWRRILFLFPAIFSLLTALLVVLSVWFILDQQPDLRTGRIITLIAAAALFCLLAWDIGMVVFRLLDKRIIMAPDALLSFREHGVQLELTRTSNIPGAPSRLGLVRYAATCPICGAKVLLDKGGKEFHGRLVGRCQESPDEHVYSFDRVTRSGKSMR